MNGRQIISRNHRLFLNKDDLRYGRKTGTLKYSVITRHYSGHDHKSFVYDPLDVEKFILCCRPDLHNWVARHMGD